MNRARFDGGLDGNPWLQPEIEQGGAGHQSREQKSAIDPHLGQGPDRLDIRDVAEQVVARARDA